VNRVWARVAGAGQRHSFPHKGPSRRVRILRCCAIRSIGGWSATRKLPPKNRPGRSI